MFLTRFAAAVVATVGLVSSITQAGYLTNGSFETVTGDDFDSWTETPGTAVADSPTVLAGSHSAKVVKSGTSAFSQSVNDPEGTLTSWQFNTKIAALAHSTQRSLQINLHHDGGNINLIIKSVNGTSEVWLYGGGWTSGLLQGAFNFSIDGNSDGDLSDPGDTLAINTIRITGHYDAASPAYDVEIVDDLGNSQSVLGRTEWQNSAAVAGSTLTSASYQAGNIDSTGYFIVDDASVVNTVPEPASAALVSLGLLSLACRRRRQVRA